MSAILKEIRILETSNSASYKSMSTAMFLLNSKTPQCNKGHDKRPQSCVFCKGPHAAHLCTTITDHQRRLDIVKQNNLCLARHKVSQCSFKFQCRHCKRKHHTSLSKPDDKPIAVHLWTDSQIVLLKNGTHLQLFVHQCVKKILQHFPVTHWSFTPSEDNPADLLGPDWLPDMTNWPKWIPSTVLEIQALED